MARVFKRKWKSDRTRKVRPAWGYTVQINGKQARKFSATWTQDDAQRALAARLLEREAAAAPPPVKTFADVAREYLEFKRAKGKRSIVEDERDLRRFTAEFGADTPITEITAQRIAAYDRQRVTETSRLKRPITPASVNRELATLRHLLRLAEEWGYLERAPRIRLAKEPEGRLRYLEQEEAARLLTACGRSRCPHLRVIVTLALNTGMRKSEILGLTWERVDLARGVLQLEQTKNGRRREIPMNRAVYDVLSSLPRAIGGGPLFRKANGAAWASIRTAFERAVETAKLTDFRFHDLRHTFASWLVQRGRSLKEVQEALGHRTLAMTMRYAHLSPERLREAVASLDDFSTSSAHGTVESERALVSA